MSQREMCHSLMSDPGSVVEGEAHKLWLDVCQWQWSDEGSICFSAGPGVAPPAPGGGAAAGTLAAEAGAARAAVGATEMTC